MAHIPAPAALDAAPEKCPTARNAVKFYAGRIAYWNYKFGTSTRIKTNVPKCPRHLAHVLQRKAYGLRRAYAKWHAYHYDWRSWMPDKHQRVGACETGYGKRPGNFHWDSGRYVSFAGIYRQGYDDDAHRIGNLGWDETLRKLGRYPTPREQMQAVDSHRAAHGGWSGWGCRGA